MKNKAQELFDKKVLELKKIIETIEKFSENEFLNNEELFTEKKNSKTLTDDEIDLLYEVGVLNGSLKNKFASIIEFKKFSESLGITLNQDEYLKIPGVIVYENTYNEWLETQDYFKFNGEKIVINEEVKSESLSKFKETIYNLEVPV